jgi:hypothetical protein
LVVANVDAFPQPQGAGDQETEIVNVISPPLKEDHTYPRGEWHLLISILASFDLCYNGSETLLDYCIGICIAASIVKVLEPRCWVLPLSERSPHAVTGSRFNLGAGILTVFGGIHNPQDESSTEP